MSTDADWEKWGLRDPYYGVLTDPKFRNENLNEDSKKAFFESGEAQIGHVFAVVKAHLDSQFSPRRALDFGCGTGRVAIPLAKLAEEVTGLDVSPAMLEEARKNCVSLGATNVRLLKSDDDLSELTGKFDFIHSSIVFQHIPPNRGLRIFAQLFERLADGGVCAVHFTYGKTHQGKFRWWRRILRAGKRALVPFVPGLDPVMEMNFYPLNELLRVIQQGAIPDLHLEFSDHGGYLGVLLYFRRVAGR
jgi:SAM-dependent methyltransferase